ncbi:MAG: hypothetical protein C4334_12585 [Pyrinomonas sp.]
MIALCAFGVKAFVVRETFREESVQPRRSALLMIAIGLVFTTALSLVPYALKLWQRDESQSSVHSFSTYAADLPSPIVREPVFDVAAWYAARGEELERHGVYIETLDGSQVLAALNPDVPFNPASLSKLATSLAALERLGANHRFRTELYLDGTLDARGNFSGNIYVASDDPLFGDVQAAAIAAKLRARGIRRIAGTLYVSPGFCFNFTDAPEEAAARLVRALKMGQPKTGVADPPPFAPTISYESYRLRDVLLYMNAHSSNFVADRLTALVGGPETIQKLLTERVGLPRQEVFIECGSGLGHNRLTPRGIVATLRALIEELQKQGLSPEEIMPFAGCDAGTLRHRLRGTPLEGALVGKTGTLTTIDGGMASLAGVVYTADRGPVLFALLNQGPQVWQSRQMEDELLLELLSNESAPRVPAGSASRRKLLPPLAAETNAE